MFAVRKNTIQIINPAIKREGRPPRDLTMADVITVPVDYTRGSHRVIDLLSPESALAVMRVYNRLNATA